MAHFKYTKQIPRSPHSKDTVTWICLETWNRKLGSFPSFMTNTVGVLTLKWKVLCWSDFDPEPWSQSTVSNAEHNSQRKSPLGKILGLKRFKCARLEPTHRNKVIYIWSVETHITQHTLLKVCIWNSNDSQTTGLSLHLLVATDHWTTKFHYITHREL